MLYFIKDGSRVCLTWNLLSSFSGSQGEIKLLRYFLHKEGGISGPVCFFLFSVKIYILFLSKLLKSTLRVA